jgi:hypothetical protein
MIIPKNPRKNYSNASILPEEERNELILISMVLLWRITERTLLSLGVTKATTEGHSL